MGRWAQLVPSKILRRKFLRVYAKLLSPEALFLAQNAPQTIWRLGCAQIREKWGK